MKYCCCGCSIQFGALLIIWMRTMFLACCLFIALWDIEFYGHTWHTFITLYLIIEITVAILGLFAVHNKKPMLLLPYYTNQVIGVILTALVITAFLILSALTTYLHHLLHELLNEYDLSRLLGAIVLIFDFIVDTAEGFLMINLLTILVIEWYFSIVIHSCYRLLRQKKLKSEAAPEPVAPAPTVLVGIPVFYTVQQQPDYAI